MRVLIALCLLALVVLVVESASIKNLRHKTHSGNPVARNTGGQSHGKAHKKHEKKHNNGAGSGQTGSGQHGSGQNGSGQHGSGQNGGVSLPDPYNDAQPNPPVARESGGASDQKKLGKKHHKKNQSGPGSGQTGSGQHGSGQHGSGQHGGVSLPDPYNDVQPNPPVLVARLGGSSDHSKQDKKHHKKHAKKGSGPGSGGHGSNHGSGAIDDELGPYHETDMDFFEGTDPYTDHHYVPDPEMDIAWMCWAVETWGPPPGHSCEEEATFVIHTNPMAHVYQMYDNDPNVAAADKHAVQEIVHELIQAHIGICHALKKGIPKGCEMGRNYFPEKFDMVAQQAEEWGMNPHQQGPYQDDGTGGHHGKDKAMEFAKRYPMGY